MRTKRKLPLKEIVLFGIFPAMMYASQLAMSGLANIHLIGMFTIVLTRLYRLKALIPLYVYVFIVGLFNGFNAWWVPYLYIWTVLWGLTMLLPKKLPDVVAVVAYPLLCAFHGLTYGAMYAPAQALMYGYNLKQTVTWIIAGLPFDALHCIGDFAMGLLIFPLLKGLQYVIKD